MFPAERIVEAQWVAEKRGLRAVPLRAAAVLDLRRAAIERVVLPTCQRYGMGVITWSPLDGGWLSGRYLKVDDLKENSRVVAIVRRRGGTLRSRRRDRP